MIGGSGMNTLPDDYVNDISQIDVSGTRTQQALLGNLAQSGRSATRSIWSRRGNPHEVSKRLILLGTPAGLEPATHSLEESCWSNDFKDHSDKSTLFRLLNLNG